MSEQLFSIVMQLLRVTYLRNLMIYNLKVDLMTAPKKMANCHPDRPNYERAYCKECVEFRKHGGCIHLNVTKDKLGRCNSCQSRAYYQRRNKGIGDKFGTIRSSRTMCDIEDPVLRKR